MKNELAEFIVDKNGASSARPSGIKSGNQQPPPNNQSRTPNAYVVGQTRSLTHLPNLSNAKAATIRPGNSARLVTKTSRYTWSEPSAPAAAAAATPPPHSPPPANCGKTIL